MSSKLQFIFILTLFSISLQTLANDHTKKQENSQKKQRKLQAIIYNNVAPYQTPIENNAQYNGMSYPRDLSSNNINLVGHIAAASIQQPQIQSQQNIPQSNNILMPIQPMASQLIDVLLIYSTLSPFLDTIMLIDKLHFCLIQKMYNLKNNTLQ